MRSGVLLASVLPPPTPRVWTGHSCPFSAGQRPCMTGAMPGAIICYLYDCVCCLSLRAVYLYIAFVSVVGI